MLASIVLTCTLMNGNCGRGYKAEVNQRVEEKALGTFFWTNLQENGNWAFCHSDPLLSLSARSLKEITQPQKTGQTSFWIKETASVIYSD